MSENFGAMPNETVVIGENVLVKPFTAIGFFGFGFKKNKETGKYRIPLERNDHSNWKVILKDDVEIGSGCSIDRGSWRHTIIEEGTKIDNLVHIGHNAHIGKHCLIVSGAVIGGSANIGDECFIGMNASIKDRITIGNKVIVGAGAVVVKDVPDGVTVVGNPAHILDKKE